MSVSEPFNVDKIISLWTELLTLQIDLGFYSDNDAISFPPPEGRHIDEVVCDQFGLSDDVISLMRRLPCPSTFDEAWESTVFNESMAIPFTDSDWVRRSRDLENCWSGPGGPVRADYMNSGDLCLVVDKDETGYHLILDTKENTARFYMAMIAPYDSGEEEEYQPERPDDRIHYRNYPARPAIEVLEELIAKFRNLEWIPMRYDGAEPELVSHYYDEDEGHPNAYSNVKNILRNQFGWPDNFDKERWNAQRSDIWKEVMNRY